MTRPMFAVEKLSPILLLLSVAACSGGDKKSNDGPDAAPSADAAPAFDAAPQGLACATVSNYGDQGVLTGDVLSDTTAGMGYLSIGNVLDQGPPVDIFAVELFEGYPPFEAGITTGTFPITGAQTNYADCGTCVMLFADSTQDGAAMIYIAQSGTVNVTSVEGNFTGSFVPDGETTMMVGQEPNSGTMTFDPRTDCTVTGGGATWDKAIPPATP